MISFLVGDVVSEDEFSLSSTKGQRVACDFNINDSAIFFAVSPHLDAVKASSRPRDGLEKDGSVLLRSYVFDRHREELLPREAVVSYGGVLPSQKAQDFRAENPHGQRVGFA